MQTSIPVSVIIVTKEEEKNIAKCLGALSRFDEVFVVDSMSKDRTQDIARSMGAQVVPFVWNGEYPKKKQWSLDNLPIRHDWVLWVDADEEVYPELAEEIAGLVASGPDAQGYFVRFDYVFHGKILKHGHPTLKLVFHNRFKGRFIPQDDLGARTSGDQEVHVHPLIDGRVSLLRERMLHNDHDSLFAYFNRHNWYSDWEAVLRSRDLPINSGSAQPGSRGLQKKIYDRLPARPLVFFANSFVVQRGFLDGRAGFHYALSKAFYYWQIDLKTREQNQKRAKSQAQG